VLKLLFGASKFAKTFTKQCSRDIETILIRPRQFSDPMTLDPGATKRSYISDSIVPNTKFQMTDPPQGDVRNTGVNSYGHRFN
jgi:ABC-type ATPase involved in cell division